MTQGWRTGFGDSGTDTGVEEGLFVPNVSADASFGRRGYGDGFVETVKLGDSDGVGEVELVALGELDGCTEEEGLTDEVTEVELVGEGEADGRVVLVADGEGDCERRGPLSNTVGAGVELGALTGLVVTDGVRVEEVVGEGEGDTLVVGVALGDEVVVGCMVPSLG